MKILKVTSSLVLFLISSFVYGQKIYNYGMVSVIDARADSIYYNLNRNNNKVIIPNINKQIISKDSIPKNIIILHSYYYLIRPYGPYCNFEATRFVKIDNKYFKQSHLEIFYCLIGKKISDSNEIFESLINDIGFHSKRNDSHSYTINELLNFDSFERSSLRLFKDSILTDGVYLSYNSFANQTPDYNKFQFGMDHNLEFKLKVELENKMKKMKPENVYAVVKNGDPYIGANIFGFNFIHRDGNLLNFKAQMLSATNISKTSLGEFNVKNFPVRLINPFVAEKFERRYNFDSYAVYRAFINYKTGSFKIYEMISGD